MVYFKKSEFWHRTGVFVTIEVWSRLWPSTVTGKGEATGTLTLCFATFRSG